MPWSSSRPASSGRGYGVDHRKARTAALAQLQRDGIGRCCLGGEPIYPEQATLPRAHPRALVLDHAPDRQSYRGLSCWEHNSRDGARRGRARQNPLPRWR